MANGFAFVSFNLVNPSIDIIRGDITGAGEWGPNTASDRPDDLHRNGFVLERVWMEPDEDIWPTPSASSRCAAPDMVVRQLLNAPERVVVQISGVADDCDPHWQALNSTWELEMRAGERNFSLSLGVSVTTPVDVAAVSLSAYLADPMIVGMFAEGTVATQSSTYPYFPASSLTTPRVYSLGRGSALAITDIASHGHNTSTVLLSSGEASFSSGAQIILAGAFPAGRGTGAAAPGLDQWSNNYQFPVRHRLERGVSLSVTLQIWPNNKPFPTPTLAHVGKADYEGVQSILMGSFASAAGCMFTYNSLKTLSNGTVALAADEQLHPRRSNYKNQYNFFDPSGYFHTLNLQNLIKSMKY